MRSPCRPRTTLVREALAGYHYLPAARAEYLRGLDRHDETRLAYDEALLLACNTTERESLSTRRAQLPPALTPGPGNSVVCLSGNRSGWAGARQLASRLTDHPADRSAETARGL